MKLAMKRVELIIDYEQNTMSNLFIMKLIVSPVLWKLACERFSIQQHQRSNILRAIGKSAQHIPFIPHFSQTSASAAISPVTRAACNHPPRPDRTSRATLHALHMSTRAAFKL